MWHEIIRVVNLDGMYRCVECNKNLEYAKEDLDFVYKDKNRNKNCKECVEMRAMENLRKFNQAMEGIRELSKVYHVPDNIIIKAMDKYGSNYNGFENFLLSYNRQ